MNFIDIALKKFMGMLICLKLYLKISYFTLLEFTMTFLLDQALFTFVYSRVDFANLC